MKIARVEWSLAGEHNQLNALAAIAAADHVCVPADVAAKALAGFENVRRRLELRGSAAGIRVYYDFAHHPTAIAETLAGLRAAHPDARIRAVFEPRSASSCRRVFQEAFARSFSAADYVIVAAVFRSNLPEGERLSAERLAADVSAAGTPARYIPAVDEIVSTLVRERREGDRVVLMSNGAFGGIHGKLLGALREAERAR